MNLDESEATIGLLKLALKRYLETSAGNQSIHPGLEELLALRRQDLDPVKVDEIQEHLVHCASCRGDFLALSHWPDPASPPAATLPLGNTAWQHLRARIAQHQGHAPKARRRAWLQLAAAATLAALIAGPFGWFLNQQERPIVNPRLIELVPEDIAARRGEVREPQLHLQPVAVDSQWIQLAVHPPVPNRRGEHQLTLTDSNLTRFWRFTAQPNEAGFFVLLLPQTTLPPGRYVLVLASESESVATYSFVIGSDEGSGI